MLARRNKFGVDSSNWQLASVLARVGDQLAVHGDRIERLVVAAAAHLAHRLQVVPCSLPAVVVEVDQLPRRLLQLARLAYLLKHGHVVLLVGHT